VTLRSNGPLRLDGHFEVRHPSSGLICAGGETALCRCGQSAKKPFCDGTHRQVGFTA
jgi:CDGSH-type Zn-finger protein